VYKKRIALYCVTVVLAVGLVACGSGNQALKTQTAAAPANGVQKGLTAQTAAKAGEQKKEENAQGSTVPANAARSTSALTVKDVYFDFDKCMITPDSAAILKDNARWLGSNPTGRFRIEGNCDERGTVEYNLALGQKRADAARNFLLALGMDGKKIETVSYGKGKPLDSASTPEAWAKNRRDHFVTLK
jgi:peptidoglycan-associated lipoprotein